MQIGEIILQWPHRQQRCGKRTAEHRGDSIRFYLNAWLTAFCGRRWSRRQLNSGLTVARLKQRSVRPPHNKFRLIQRTPFKHPSPFLLDHTGRDLEFDTAGFLHEYPAAVRPVLKRELLKLIRRFTTAEGAIGDMVGNLQKEELYDWVDPAIEAARVHVGVQIDRAATTKMFEDDKKLMPLTLKLKRGQRWWLSHTGRTYDSMLPLRTTYDR